MSKHLGLLATVARFVFAPADEGTGAAAAAAGGAAPENSGAGSPAPAADPTVLQQALVDNPAETTEEKAAREAAAAETPEAKAAREAAEALANETPEAKAAREAKEAEARANETPEEKAAREAKEKETADAAKAETLKPYEVLKLPEGMPKEQPAYENFVAKAAELKLAPEQAQALLDTVAPELQKAINAPYEAWATIVTENAAKCATDPEFGGAKYKENMATCAKGIHAIMGADAKAFTDMLAFTGVGNFPDMIRFAFRAGKMVEEGSPVSHSGGNGPKADLAERVYPTMAKAAGG